MAIGNRGPGARFRWSGTDTSSTEGYTVQGSTYPCPRRDWYWDPELEKFDEVVFKIFPQETFCSTAIWSGQVDAGNLSDQDNIQKEGRRH